MNNGFKSNDAISKLNNELERQNDEIKQLRNYSHELNDALVRQKEEYENALIRQQEEYDDKLQNLQPSQGRVVQPDSVGGSLESQLGVSQSDNSYLEEEIANLQDDLEQTQSNLKQVQDKLRHSEAARRVQKRNYEKMLTRKDKTIKEQTKIYAAKGKKMQMQLETQREEHKKKYIGIPSSSQRRIKTPGRNTEIVAE